MSAMAVSVDVEEYFHAAALADVAPRSDWDSLDSRVVATTDATLDLFAAAGAVGTFFVLGCVAERHPALVRRIAAAGHELASHGQSHHRIREQSPAAFRADVARAKAAIEDAAGVPVIGYRAANFSLEPATWWAYDALAETGHRYSSSVNPVRHDHYGAPEAPPDPFDPGVAGIVELPLTTVRFAGRVWHASGGGYFRLAPYALARAALRRASLREKRRPIFYFHPWEIDPGQPRLRPPATARFRHYVNLDRMAGKLARLLAEFSSVRIDALFAAEIAAPPALRWSPPAGASRDGG